MSQAFICLSCGHPEVGVTDSRPRGPHEVQRRRRCHGCDVRFTTFETLVKPPKPNDILNISMLSASQRDIVRRLMREFKTSDVDPVLDDGMDSSSDLA